MIFKISYCARSRGWDRDYKTSFLSWGIHNSWNFVGLRTMSAWDTLPYYVSEIE
jgi:hypothetical protein